MINIWAIIIITIKLVNRKLIQYFAKKIVNIARNKRTRTYISVYSSVYAIVEVNGRRWELGIKHRR